MNFGIIFDAYKNSDTVGQLIVDALLLFSLFVWYIIVMKCAQCWNVRKACKSLMLKMSNMGSMQHRILGELVRDKEVFQGPLAEIGRAAYEALREVLRPAELEAFSFREKGTLPRALTKEEIEKIEVAMDNAISHQQRELIENLTVMDSIITVAPLLGLFGTVWGVMGTFIGIVNNGGRPDIQAIAPGISGALLTTVGGLFVAIPAIVVNNSVQSAIMSTDKDMEDFESIILASLQLVKTTPKSTENPPAPVAQPPAYQAPAPVVAPQPVVQPPVYQAPAVAQPPVYQAPAPQSTIQRPFYPANGVAPASQPTTYQAPAPQSQSGYTQMPSQQRPDAAYPQGATGYQAPAQETVFSVTRNPNQNL